MMYENGFDWRKLLHSTGRSSDTQWDIRRLSHADSEGTSSYNMPAIIGSGMCTQPFVYEQDGVSKLPDAICAFNIHPGHDQNSATAAKMHLLAQQLRDAFTGKTRSDTPILFKHELITRFKPKPQFDGRGKKDVKLTDYYSVV